MHKQSIMLTITIPIIILLASLVTIPTYLCAMNIAACTSLIPTQKKALLHSILNNGDTPLIEALRKKTTHPKAMQLIQEETDINTPNNNGDTPLIIAAEGGYASLVVNLLYAKAAIDAPNKEGNTALLIAATHNHVTTAHELIRANANINAQNNNGNNALIVAIIQNNRPIVFQLLNARATIHTANNRQLTPLAIALELNRVPIINLLNNSQQNNLKSAGSLQISTSQKVPIPKIKKTKKSIPIHNKLPTQEQKEQKHEQHEQHKQQQQLEEPKISHEQREQLEQKKAEKPILTFTIETENSDIDGIIHEPFWTGPNWQGTFWGCWT